MPSYKPLPLFTATKSLDVNYVFYGEKEQAAIELPGANTHAVLYAGCKEFLEVREGLNYKASFDSVNCATAAITFLYTDTKTEEGYLSEEIESMSYAVSAEDKTDRILSSMSFYTDRVMQAGVASSKAARDQVFNSSLNQRVEAFSEVVQIYDTPSGTIESRSALDEAIKGPMFHEAFHHSEQALMHYLSSQAGLMSLVHAAREAKAKYVYGIVLDIYTQRMLCCNCNACLIGMQHSQTQGFIADLTKALVKKGIEPREDGNIMLQTRVSASKAPKGMTLDALKLNDDQDKVHEYDPHIDNFILQAESQALGVKKIINKGVGKYKGALFTSSEIKSKKKWESKMALGSKP